MSINRFALLGDTLQHMVEFIKVTTISREEREEISERSDRRREDLKKLPNYEKDVVGLLAEENGRLSQQMDDSVEKFTQNIKEPRDRYRDLRQKLAESLLSDSENLGEPQTGPRTAETR